MNPHSLVLEGGGLRGTFTSGVLEYFLEKELYFAHVVGVSAGACTGASYQSRQKGRNWKVNVEVPSDKRFMGLKYLLTTGNYFNMPFIFDEVPNRLVPFDEAALFANPAAFDILMTSLSTGKCVAMTLDDIRAAGINRVLTASSSIPLLSRPVEIGGELYCDGGVADSIPVKYALEKGNKAVVVLTRPRGYRKGKMKGSSLFKLVFRKHPEFLETLLKRNDTYNLALDYCERMEKEGKLFIIAPSPDIQVGRSEPSMEKRAAAYRHGYELAEAEHEKLLSFLK